MPRWRRLPREACERSSLSRNKNNNKNNNRAIRAAKITISITHTNVLISNLHAFQIGAKEGRATARAGKGRVCLQIGNSSARMNRGIERERERDRGKQEWRTDRKRESARDSETARRFESAFGELRARVFTHLTRKVLQNKRSLHTQTHTCTHKAETHTHTWKSVYTLGFL